MGKFRGSSYGAGGCRLGGMFGPSTYPAKRFYKLTDGGGIGLDQVLTMSAPAAGADVDGASHGDVQSNQTWHTGFAAVPGMPFQIELGGTVAADDLLETDANGKAIKRVSGIALARALEAGTSGVIIGAVYTSGR